MAQLMHLDDLCPTCQSLFTAEVKQALQQSDKHLTHLSYSELLVSAQDCHLCESIATPIHKDFLRSPAYFSNKSPLELHGIRHGSDIIIVEIYAEINTEIRNKVILGSICLSKLDSEKHRNIVARRTVPNGELAETTIVQIRRWMTECISNHHLCSNVSGINRPGRLLEVSQGGQKLRLTSTNDIPAGKEYVTLSHCWGGLVDCRLLGENYDAFSQSIPLTILPRTFRECVEAVSRLGFQYLWIDALCIIQDSESDWLAESAKMGQIYEQGILNIAASASRNGREGLFHFEKPLDLRFLSLPGADDSSGDTFVVHGRHPFRKKVTKSVLNTRGWVLQERILSPRTVFFVQGEIFWECACKLAYETLSDLVYTFDGTKIVKMKNAMNQDELLRRWDSIIRSYSENDLTRGSDKLPALSGLANHFARRMNLDSDDYLAGLWRYKLEKSLWWRAFSSKNRVAHRRAPSWSWARYDGSIDMTQYFGTDRSISIRILKAQVERTPDPFGAVGPGFVTLQGPLCRLKLAGTNKPSRADSSGYHTAAIEDGCITVPVPAIIWDASTFQESHRGPLYLLFHGTRPFTGDHLCYSLVLQATTQPGGHFERVGTTVMRLSSINDALRLANNPKMLEDHAYAAFDENSGFTITIH